MPNEIWPHLPSSEQQPKRAQSNSLAEAMYGHLKKQAAEAKAKEEQKARLKKLAADVRELNAKIKGSK